MTNPYTTQTISGYNTSPPADDGSEVASNQVTWAKHKDKLGDPVKTLSEAINTEVLSAFGTVYIGHDTNAQSGNYTVLAADERKTIECTGTITITLIDVATAADGFTVAITNVGTGVVTVEGATSELVGGKTNQSLAKTGDGLILQCNGTSWNILADSRTSYEVAINENKGTDIASATTTDIGAATGNQIDVTGTTTITGLGTVQAGTRREVQFDGILTLTHNATSLILPSGANITTAAGDAGTFISLGSGNWRCHDYQRADGRALAGTLELQTVQATTSGTAFDFTGIASGARRITVSFRGVSMDANDEILVQIGPSGGIETSGYISTSVSSTSSSSTSGFVVAINATDTFSGQMVLTLIDSATNAWVSSHQGKLTTSIDVRGGGDKALAGELTQLRITRTATANFDAGAVNILIET